MGLDTQKFYWGTARKKNGENMKGVRETYQPLMQVSCKRGREKEEVWSTLWFSERFDEVRRVSPSQRHTSESLVLPFPGTDLPVPLLTDQCSHSKCGLGTDMVMGVRAQKHELVSHPKQET